MRPLATTSLALAVAILATATAMPRSSAAGGPVTYVRVCSAHGAGFHYIPGTETCLNPSRHDARVATEGGFWRWRMPNNPIKYVKSAKKACQGKFIKFGDLTAASLALDADYVRWMTTARLPFALEPGEYISGVVYKGGFTGVGSGNFCMYYYYDDPITDPPTRIFTPIGCNDTARQADLGGTVAFVPDSPIPPETMNPVFIFGANGDRWNTLTPDVIHGTLSVWLCVQKAL